MIKPSRAVAPAKAGAKPLPKIEGLAPLYRAGVNIRHGQLVMLAGFPGSMKSAFAMFLADQWNIPTLYLCADMSATTAVSRLGALRTGYTHGDVESAIQSSSPVAAEVERRLGSSNITFSFDDAPTIDDIVSELEAWVELYDGLPELLIIDNLVDLDNSGDDEYRAWRETLLWFKSLCREYGVTVIVLHHARELGKSDFPSPRKDVAGKVSQTPELVLTVALTPLNEFRVAVVKNRTGKQDAMAREGVQYTALPDHMTFRPSGSWERD